MSNNRPRKPRVGTGALSRKARDLRPQWQKDAEQKRIEINAAYAARHPSMAKEQRNLRKAQAVMVETWKHKHEGTPETHDKAANTHQGALAQLHANGTIDNDQLEWAAEIANVYRSIESDVTVAVASLEARVDQSRRPLGAAEGIRRVRLHHAYTLWRNALPAPKSLALDMIVGDQIGYTVAARRYGVHNRKAKRLLIAAIDAWPAFVDIAHRSVSADDVEAINEV